MLQSIKIFRELERVTFGRLSKAGVSSYKSLVKTRNCPVRARLFCRDEFTCRGFATSYPEKRFMYPARYIYFFLEKNTVHHS